MGGGGAGVLCARGRHRGLRGGERGVAPPAGTGVGGDWCRLREKRASRSNSYLSQIPFKNIATQARYSFDNFHVKKLLPKSK